ncbi:MAG: 2-oxo acid dehydrogenase subunit E2, partial [Desulfobacterales bacterium]
MATRVFMPKAGMAMEEGTIIQWFKKEGDRVATGDPLLEIETDKVNMEVEAPASGVLLKIIRPVGETVPVTETIGWIGEPGEEVAENEEPQIAGVAVAASAQEESAVVTAQAQSAPVLAASLGKIAATPLARKLAAEKGIDLSTIAPSGSFGEVKARDVENTEAVRATPLARKIARDLDIDLAAVKGTGIAGKIQEADVLAAGESTVAQPMAPQVVEETLRKPIRGMRKVIAERMLHSHLTAPPVTQTIKVDVTELLSVRKKLNASLEQKISINDILLKVTAIVLRQYPAINVSIDGDHLIYHPVVNLGMAVALEEGLIVPVIRNADRLSLIQISETATELAQKARSGKLMPDDYTGGTFTVSNMGSYGITSFTPIINQPESGILGVGAIEDQLTLNDNKVEVRKKMALCLTYDHRAIDGAQSAIFQNKIKAILENPHVLM